MPTPPLTPSGAAEATRHHAQRRLLAHFLAPPDLQISDEKAIGFEFPHLRELRTEKEASSAASDLSLLIGRITRKFFYQDFFDEAFYHELSWVNEELLEIDGFPTVKTRPAPTSGRLPQNWSELRARDWFRKDVIGDVTRSDGQATLRFILGEPGTGKSTLVKFLANAERQFCAESNVIVTRLEASKLYQFIDGRLFAMKAYEGSDSERRIHYHNAYREFFNFISLRDLFFNIDVILYGRVVSPSDVHSSSLERVIANIVSDALELTRYKDSIHEIFEEITDSIHNRFGNNAPHSTLACRHHFKHLLELDNEIVVRLLRQALSFIESRVKSTLKILVVFDGFDLLSPEDAFIDTDKLDLLKSILHTYNSLNKTASGFGRTRVVALKSDVTRGVGQHAVILMRTNTYNLLVEPENRETFLPNVKLNVIDHLSSDVVMFRAFMRASEQLKDKTQDLSTQASVNGAFILIQTMLSRIGDIEQKVGKNNKQLRLSNLDVFDGNLRDCFRAVKRLLELMAQEGVADSQINERPNLKELLSYAESRSGEKLAQWRGYRVPEFLLLGHRTHFINAMRSRPPNSLTRIQKIHSFDSLFDNAFDYFCDLYDARLGMHNLLLKIRILQLLATSSLVIKEEIMSHLQSLGYNATSEKMIDDALLSLRFGGLVFVFVEDGYRFTEKVDAFQISNRGSSLIKNLIFDPAYLEHVFHQSLFPRSIVRCISDNTRRDNLDGWIAASIRNYFVILTYVSFLETNIPEQGSSWRLTPELKKRMVRAVIRIAKADRRKGGAVVLRANELVEVILGDWRDQGLVL